MYLYHFLLIWTCVQKTTGNFCTASDNCKERLYNHVLTEFIFLRFKKIEVLYNACAYSGNLEIHIHSVIHFSLIFAHKLHDSVVLEAPFSDVQWDNNYRVTKVGSRKVHRISRSFSFLEFGCCMKPSILTSDSYNVHEDSRCPKCLLSPRKKLIQGQHICEIFISLVQPPSSYATCSTRASIAMWTLQKT